MPGSQGGPGARCPRCRHVSRDASPKFCSECGARIPPAAASTRVEAKLPVVPKTEVDSVEEQRVDVPGELRHEAPTDSPSIGAQKKKKKKKNRKRKNKDSTSVQADSLTSLNSEAASLGCEVSGETNPEEDSPLKSLGSEAGSLLCEASGDLKPDNQSGRGSPKQKLFSQSAEPTNVDHAIPARTNPSPLVEQQVLLTSSCTVPPNSTDSIPVKRISEEMQTQGTLTLMEKSAVPLTESSPDVNGNCAGEPARLPVQEEDETSGAPQVCDPSAIASLAGKVEHRKDTEGGNSTPEGSSTTQTGKPEKTFGGAQTDKETEVAIHKKSSGTNAAQDSLPATEIPMTGDQRGKTDQAGAGKGKGTQAGPENEKKAQDGRGNKKGPHAGPPNERGAQAGAGQDKGAQAGAGQDKGAQAGAGQEKVAQAGLGKRNTDKAASEEGNKDEDNCEKAKEDQADSEKGIEKGDNSEKGTKNQANSQKTRGKEKKNKSLQKSTAEPEKTGNTENREGTGEPPASSQKNTNQGVTYCRPVNPADLVTVYFHAIVSPHFNLDVEKHKVVVRASGIPGYTKWKDNICEMNFSKKLKEHGMLVEGFISVPKKDMTKVIPYKYCIVGGKNEEYEFIYKQDVQNKANVNRCLKIPENYLATGEWHQYDDIVCAKPDKGFFDRLLNVVGMDDTKKKVIKGKEIAGEIMLDSIFNLLTTLNSTNLMSFITQLHHFYIVSCSPMVHENGPRQWTSLQFGEREVNALILNALNKVAQPILSKKDESSMPENTIVKSRLAAGLIILMLVEYYRLGTSTEQLNQVCSLLCLEKMSRGEILDQLESMKAVFSINPHMEQYLTVLCRRCIDEKADQWVWVLPVLHFFSNSLNPDESPLLGARLQQEDSWAGLDGLPFHDVRSNHMDKRTLLQLMKGKQYLLEVDRTLGRSWFCLLPLEHTPEFLSDMQIDVMDALLGTYYRLKDVTIGYVDEKKVQELLQKLLMILELPKNRARQQEALESRLRISLRIHDAICKNVKEQKFYEIPALSACILFKVARSAEDLKEALENVMPKGSIMDEIVQEALKYTQNWFRTVLSKRLFTSVYSGTVKDELQVWGRFVCLNVPSGHLADLWKSSLLSDLEGKIKQEGAFQQIEVFCRHHDIFEDFHSSISMCFENCAIEAVHSACQSGSDILGKLSLYDMHKFGKLLSAVITKSWPTDANGRLADEFDVVLNHLLLWPGVKHIFKLYGADGQLLVQLTDEAKTLMAVADSVFIEVMENLMKGTLLVKRLKCISQNKTQFLGILELKQKHLSGQKGDERRRVSQVLKWRMEELECLKREKEWVDCLLKMCRNVGEIIKVDIDEVQRMHVADLGLKQLDDVVEVKLLEVPSESEAVTVTYYSLSHDVKKMAEQLHTFKDSLIFTFCWEKEAQSMVGYAEYEEDPDRVLTLEELNSELFNPCFDQYQDIYKNLQSGNLTFKVVDDIFKDYKNRYEELRKDLRIMCRLAVRDPGKWIDDRVQQIEQYHQLHLAIDSAKAIAKVKEGLKLSGDFRILETLLTFAEDFEGPDEQTLSCISKQLMQTRQVLADITEARRTCLEVITHRKVFIFWVKEALEDINELKVFVDLASISAGENDMDVDRVACFHDAVLGYASLLYDLKPEAGFQELMQCLKKLWKALENDEKLPKKLEDSARHLEWLKTVKESHGSVELSSLSLATSINSKGIYLIGAPAEGKVSPDTVLQLILPENHEDSEEERCYSLEELKELMNKLMLMSGKGDQGNAEVEMFSEVFCNVIRLTLSFIDLHSAGNVLFRRWEATVYCSSNCEVRISMDFHLPVIGTINVGGKLMDLLPIICQRMEFFLEQWKDFMKQKRKQHYYLNYYTAEQLVYLCQQFERTDISKEALMMLSFIKPSCTKHNIMSLVRDRRMCLLTDRMAGIHHSWDTGETETESQPSLSQSHTEKKHISDLRILVEKEEKLINRLNLIWKYYMECMSAFLPGCLDIETLGRSLALLVGKEVYRTLPQSLRSGCPNLILCPHIEILPSALAIYMHSPDQELPTYDEVLLCTPETTFEQVELFLRRCLTPGYPGQKVYTALYADELSYDVGYRSEQLFQQLKSQTGQDYCLVLLCNSSREHSYIPSVFSKYKVHVVPHEPEKKVQEYLRKHYTVARNIPSAAAVFRDRTCVGIVSSKRAGVGKSLYVKRLHSTLLKIFADQSVALKTIRVIDPRVDESKLLRSLLPFLSAKYEKKPIIFHFDITSSVQTGISEFLFKLFVLQYLMDTNGRMWKRSHYHLYVVEILEASVVTPKKQPRVVSRGPQYSFLDVFPKVTCRAPKEVLQMEMENQPVQNDSEAGMDTEEFRSEAFQRPYQYLLRFQQHQNLDTFKYIPGSVQGSTVQCLQMLLIYCGIMDPSWSELRNFAWFLNCQLRDCESSLFCNPDFVGDTLQGFKNFVVNFMILMAKDFATPSLNISDQSSARQTFNLDGIREEDLAPFLVRKKWESEPHPYIFFNDDRVSMTFIGFHLQPNSNGGVDAINPADGKIIKDNIMTKQLYQGLQLQRVPFNVDFDSLRRAEKIEKLCMVLGIQWPMDPDDTYELTMDNILKILAIQMRFRCGIPVIVMGETGCGKTRLIKYLCELRKSGVSTENMKLVKVHGGTTADMIYTKIREAEAIAIQNKSAFQLDTVLFFDEANTTEAISSIKEALCDHTVEGKPLSDHTGLHIIAACNPYRKHTPEMIKRLESAGLGYRVKADETKEKLGSIPLRQLVYRVHSLPPSMIPLVWDFGQLNNHTERKYIQQIVQRLAASIELSKQEVTLLTNVLFVSQCYMRRRNDECSFVSLRDVERCVEVFKWFYNHSSLLLNNLQRYLERNTSSKDFMSGDKVTWSLVLAVGVCYHASLEKKEEYRKAICKFLLEPYVNPQTILQEITRIQDLFLSGVPLRETIARNLALKENVFMMVICIELKIPLFLVGKPGSSKSLAKTIVADAMQGQAAHKDLYKELKQIHLVSFQCSPHSTPEGIIGTFKHCARFQKGKNLDEYVSVVVLDEIGLAEDSPKMPLKTLHPLLEDGCIDDDPHPHKKVGFIGISNWALDPAKMNRGIFVSRGDPNERELIESAKGICSSNNVIHQLIKSYFPLFANAYTEICKTQTRQEKEFFGLRDYYSLIKMVFAFTKSSEKEPTIREIVQAVLRNFSGKDDVNALHIFKSILKGENYPDDVNTIDLIQQNIRSDDGECRYLLVLTKNYAALQILQQVFFTGGQQPEIIFGSSFPKDQEYTQICRNINRVKICMETGQMVILLNLQNLYESLYDALNQYYVYLAGQKYVDLGLGTHRVKCRVHPSFHLIVIEEKEVVYKQFPIPLINRLEKHYLDINTVLSKNQSAMVKELEKWVEDFTAVNTEHLLLGQQKYSPSDVFIGYHSDTCASVILQVTEKLKQQWSQDDHCPTKVVGEAKTILLNCATPDSVIRLSGSKLGTLMAQNLAQEYFKKQKHNSLGGFLYSHIHTESDCRTTFTEITTFSRLLTLSDTKNLEREGQSIAVLSLQQFDTEHSFLKEIRNFLDSSAGSKILIIQTDFEDGSQSAHLIASAKYSAVNEINKLNLQETSVFVYFITKLSRMEGDSYVGFHGGLWQSMHIDDLRRSKDMVSDVTALQQRTISQLFCPDEKTGTPEPMNVDSNTETIAEAGVETVTPMETEASSEAEMESETEAEAKAEVEREQRTAMEAMAGIVTEIRTEAPGMQTEMTMEVETVAEMETNASSGMEMEASERDVLDTTTLIRSCVQSAVGMLRDQNEASARSTRRIEILLNLLSREDELRALFLASLKDRLYDLLKKQEESSFKASEWVVKEASNPDALQEAGTFRHTLWKRVQAVVTPFLAHVVSIIDRDSNLELLFDTERDPCVKKLWIFIFSDLKLLNVPYTMSDSSSHSETILVQNYMKLPDGMSNAMPFSWRIKDYLDELYSQAQYIKDGEGTEKFVDIFIQTPLGVFISRLSEGDQRELFLRYVRDFLLLSMSVSSLDELQFLQMALLSCIEELKTSQVMNEETDLSLPWVHLGYHHFMHRLQNFSRILAVNPKVLKMLTVQIEEMEAMTRHEMALDVFAAVACTEMLEAQVLQPSPPLWLRLVKNLQMPIEVICAAGTYFQGRGIRCQQWLQQIKTRWNRVFSMALFVEHVLLEVGTCASELKKLVKEHTTLLGKCLQRDSNIKTERPFIAVIEVLRKCREAASSVFCRFGIQVCPICHGDPEQPVCLSCDHVYCQLCISRWLTPGQMYCPLCKTSLPDDYCVTVSKDLSTAIKKNVWFRGLCNSFFLDLVSTLCFKDNVPPDKKVILELLSLLFLNKELRDAIHGNRKTLTKSLSPFDDSVDKNPVIRSVILKLLLKYSFEDVKEYIQQYLSTVQERNILGEEDKTEVYTLFVNCLEDSMYEKVGSCSGAEKQTHLREEGLFIEQYLQLNSRSPYQESSIEYLQGVARIRLCLDTAAELLFQLHSGTEAAKCKENQVFLRHIENFCTKAANDWFRVYLVRKLTNQYGMEFVQKLSKEHRSDWLLPQEIIQQQRDQLCQIDLFLVCGEGYRILRDVLGTALIKCKTKGITAAQKECKSSKAEQAVHLILAVFREVTVLYGSHNTEMHPKQAQCEAVNGFIEQCKVLEPPNLKQFALSLVANNRPSLNVAPGHSSARSTMIEMLVHTAAVLLCGQNRILEPLRNLAFSPANMQNSFLPTMPEDLLVNATTWQGLQGVHWYQCPNGHFCTVGECGRPMQLARCVDCNAQIGGQNHRPEPGFKVIQQFVDRTQTGHILGDPRNREGVVAPDREITPVAFIILRLLTHLAMALGAEQDPQSLLGTIKPPVQDVMTFLQRHVEKDLDQLRNTLGKSADETTNVVHLILCSLLKEPHQQPNQWPVGFDGMLSSKQSRAAWEKIVATTVITPEIKNLERKLLEVNARISQDKRISANPVVKIVYGDPKTFLSVLPMESHVHCSKIWSCRKRISIEYLGHVAQQKDGKDTVPILWKFLQKDAELRLVKFLPDILALQRDLVKKFQNVTDVDFKKISDFLYSLRSDGMKYVFKRRIDKFLTAWNQLRRSLDTNGEIKLPQGSCDSLLTMESPFEILLPRRQGLGLCATALVSYLISLHNEFVYTVEQSINETRKYSVSPSEVSDLHVISYEVEKDLIPIILSNCEYSVESGGEVLQELDLKKIQRQVTSRFLQGKPIITLKGIPTLVYRQDRNYENTFVDIKAKLQQDILSNSMINTISGELHSYSDICEALSVTEVTLGFLATAGGESEQPLVQYVEEVLQMGDQTSEHVLEALSRCHLKHTIALWQLLSARKSEHLIRLKRDPFAEVAEEYKATLSADDVGKLNMFLAQASLDTFLLELHEMILLKLKHVHAVQEFKPSWSLRHTLCAVIERKRENAYPELEDSFPEKILMSHCVEAWKAAAALKRNRPVR